MSKCVVCHTNITYQFSLCAACEAEYGRRAGNWPPWVRYLVNQSRRERRAEAKYARHEVSSQEAPDDSYTEDWDKDRFT